jgi:hypothetical protein
MEDYLCMKFPDVSHDTLVSGRFLTFDICIFKHHSTRHSSCWIQMSSIPRRWRHNRCCPLFPNQWVIVLGQTPGIVTDLGFLTRQLASSWYMSEPQGCSIAALLLSILISVTAIIAKTTWKQRFLSFKSAEMSRNRRSLPEVHVIATSRIHYSDDLVIYK